MQEKHAGRISVRVYYEDTDAAGVVYYANYLKFIERGRTELLRRAGFEQHRLSKEHGVAFAVRSLNADYLQAARLDDELEVTSAIESMGRAQILFHQEVRRAGELLFTAQVRIACFDPARGRAAAMPRPIYDFLRTL